MHSRTFGRTTFHFNSDFSGDVCITCDERDLSVPMVDLLLFMVMATQKEPSENSAANKCKQRQDKLNSSM